MSYTMQRLKTQNQSYDMRYGLTDNDLNMVNHYVKQIESSRSKSKPKTGDILILTNACGNYYPAAHLEFDCYQNENKISYCERPYVPFLSERNHNISCSTSGGAWGHIPIDSLVYISTRLKTFCDFGSHIARAGGAVYFDAKVSVWEYNCNKQPYSTKTHDKYYIYHDTSKNAEYAYTANGGHAWRTKEDLQAWIRTYRGECSNGNISAQMTVWTYKEKEIHVSPDVYEALNLPEDTIAMNGIRRCKRKYDDKNHLVLTYFVWYWNAIDTFNTSVSHQNRMIKHYELDWKTPINQLARNEFKKQLAKPVNIDIYFK